MANTERSQIHTALALPLPPVADLSAVKRPERAFVDLYQQYGPIFRLPRDQQELLYGSVVQFPQADERSMTVLAGPEANLFLARYGDEYISTQLFWDAFDKALGYDKRRHDGEAHRQYRRLLSRGYSRGAVIERIPEMVAITREVLQSWRPGQTIAVVPWMRRLITEQLGRLLVNRGPGEKLVDILCYFQMATESALLGIAPRSDLEQATFIAARQRVLELAQEIIAVHRAQPADERRRDVVDDIFSAIEQSPDLLAERDILVSAIIPYIAGLGTIVYTASFLFYTLLAHPGVLQRVAEEVDKAWVQGSLNKESLKAMPALHGAAMETLRIYQTTSAWDGMARKTFAFEGYRVEKGAQVFGATTVSHFLPHIFADPETFDIDRYYEPRNEHRQHGAFAAFGIGDHSCIGAGIAEIQLAVIFATILHDYRWQNSAGSAHPTIVPALTPAPSDEFSITLLER